MATNKKGLSKDIVKYWHERSSLYIHEGLVFIPSKMRNEMLEKLHQGHVGITKMKTRARNITCWPGITKAIEQAMKKCKSSSIYDAAKIEEPMLSHDIPNISFTKIGVDVAESEEITI